MDINTIIGECWSLMTDISALERNSKDTSHDASQCLHRAYLQVSEAINCLEDEKGE